MILTPLQNHVLEEARTWIGTPWRQGGSAVKGKQGGVDCSRFALMVFHACGAAPLMEIEVVNPIYCHGRRNPSLILEWLSQHPDIVTPVEGGLKNAQPCDVICSRVGAIVHHMAILDEDGRHAIGAIERYGVTRYMVVGDVREEKRVKAVYRVKALC